MANEQESYRSAIIHYYAVLQDTFNRYWSSEYLRYGFWDQDTRNLRQSLMNVDTFVMESLRMSGDDVVLDAGCGVGGTAIHIAKALGAKVVGITICPSHLEAAREKASKVGVADFVSFAEQDYTATSYEDGSFTKIYGIESVYQSENYFAFAKEMFRLLKKRGMLAVVDRFLRKSNLSTKETNRYNRFLQGQVVKKLVTVKQFRHDLERAGFTNIFFHDKVEAIKRSVRKSCGSKRVTYPLNALLAKLKVVPKKLVGHTLGARAIKNLFDNGAATYGVWVAEKT